MILNYLLVLVAPLRFQGLLSVVFYHEHVFLLGLGGGEDASRVLLAVA